MNKRAQYFHGIILIGLSLVMLLLTSCGDSPQPIAKSTSNIRMTDERLINFNKSLIKLENQKIEDFISRYQWKMKISPTGLRYLIYQQGRGAKARTGLLARMNYQLRLLNGQVVYTSDSLGPKEFIIGYGGVESGLEEALLLLREGDKAKIIIPAYLAYGLAGDQQKIPPGATLVYDMELIELKTIK